MAKDLDEGGGGGGETHNKAGDLTRGFIMTELILTMGFSPSLLDFFL